MKYTQWEQTLDLLFINAFQVIQIKLYLAQNIGK